MTDDDAVHRNVSSTVIVRSKSSLQCLDCKLKISNKLAGDVACPSGSMVEHQLNLLGSRVRFPAGAFAIFPFLPKLHFQFPFSFLLSFLFLSLSLSLIFFLYPQGYGKYVPLMQQLFGLMNNEWTMVIQTQRGGPAPANEMVGSYLPLWGVMSNNQPGMTCKLVNTPCTLRGPLLLLGTLVCPFFS